MAKTPTVVLIEDSPTQSKAIAWQLNQLGLEVVIANDGPPGLIAVIQNLPDAVILDVNLPSMNGYQVADRLKRDPTTSGIPVIMLTVRDQTADMVTGLNHGADYFIPKGPDATDELCRTLRGFGLIAWQ